VKPARANGSDALSRRTFLRGAGVAIALPWLECMASACKVGAAAATEAPRRMVLIETNMGILPQYFFPEEPGRGFATTPYLRKLDPVRGHLTVFSGVSHPGVTGGHVAEKCFLTGTPHPERGGFRNGISLDQFAAERVGDQTRYPSLALSTSGESATLSFTRSGAPIPAERSPSRLYQKLFMQGDRAQVEAGLAALGQDRSVLDFVSAQAKRLERSLSKPDRRRMDQYYTSVRELERRLGKAVRWEHRPKPKVEARVPTDVEDAREFVRQTQLMYDMIKLAVETDSTRVITLFIDTTVIHTITHHGNRPEVLAELRAKEEGQFQVLGGFLKALHDTPEGGETLLDRSMVLYGTCMGSANSHSNVNLPVLLAGGGFRHGQHLAFDREDNYPLANLFVSMLQRLGLESGEFSSGRGTARGLEMS
jgi:hypothetical protein